MTEYERGFLTKCAEYGIDGRMLLKVAYNNGIGMTPEQYRAYIREEEAADDAYFDGKAQQLSSAGQQSGEFSAGKFIGGEPKVQPAQQIPPTTSPDYSMFNKWYEQNGDDFKKMFSDENGVFSKTDYNRFKDAYPMFFTGSDEFRNRMFTRMKNSGPGPYTVANSGPGWNFRGRKLDASHVD